MFIRALVTRDGATPPSCKPFTIHSNVCVGDLIAIIACSIAGVGFFFWAIHAVRKMRENPFEQKDQAVAVSEWDRPFRVPPSVDGVVTLDHDDRVRARLALSQPNEEPYQPSPIAPHTFQCACAQCSMATPRRPPLAAGHSRRSSSRSPGRHGSLTGGPYAESYDGEHGMYDDEFRNVSPERARSSPLHRSSSGYHRTYGDPMTYAY